MDFKGIFQRFNDLNILIIGDVMIDSYYWGKVSRLSPEAPVPICEVKEIENRLGGAANVALNIKAMGAKAIICSVIGEDSQAKIFESLLDKDNLSTQGIVFSPYRPTTIKTRVIGNKSHLLRVDKETTETLNDWEQEQLLSKIKTTINDTHIDAIIFQDYDKGVLNQNIISQVLTICKEKHIPTMVDPKHRNFAYYKGVSIFKPNLKELKEGLKIEFDQPNIDNLSDAALLLHDKQNIERVFITLGQYGVFIADYSQKNILQNNSNSVIYPAHLRNIADVSGAGDTVISVATLCFAVGLSADWIAKISNLSGGLVCEQVGVVAIDKDRLYKEVLQL